MNSWRAARRHWTRPNGYGHLDDDQRGIFCAHGNPRNGKPRATGGRKGTGTLGVGWPTERRMPMKKKKIKIKTGVRAGAVYTGTWE
jgi:hypothetical protein